MPIGAGGWGVFCGAAAGCAPAGEGLEGGGRRSCLPAAGEPPFLQSRFQGQREIHLVRLVMKKTVVMLCFSLFAFATLSLAQTQVDPKWQIHDLNRPVPAVIEPGTASTQDAARRAPSAALVPFAGKDLSTCPHNNGTPAK